MNLIDVYIHEVTSRLPAKNREDIALELRSTIEDMLPENPNEEDVKDVLEKLGNPAVLAGRYRERPMHLIGPRYYDAYVTFLKMILPISIVVAIISIFAQFFIGYEGNEGILQIILIMFGQGILTMIEVAIQVFFWLTIVFAVIERVDHSKGEQPLRFGFKKWRADDLKDSTYTAKEKVISKLHVFGGLMWTAVWATFYYYADHLIGIYEGGSEGLRLITPVFNQEILLFYWPLIILLIILEVAFALYKLIREQWTKGMALLNSGLEVISAVLFIVILLNPNLLTQDFLIYMSNLLNVSGSQLEVWIVVGAIFVFIISAVGSIVDGFRKARLFKNF